MQTTLTSADKPRLTTQQEHVEAIMGDGRWRTLGWSVERRRIAPGLHIYRAEFLIAGRA